MQHENDTAEAGDQVKPDITSKFDIPLLDIDWCRPLNYVSDLPSGRDELPRFILPVHWARYADHRSVSTSAPKFCILRCGKAPSSSRISADTTVVQEVCSGFSHRGKKSVSSRRPRLHTVIRLHHSVENAMPKAKHPARRFLIRRPTALQWFHNGELKMHAEEERQAGRFELFLDLLCEYQSRLPSPFIVTMQPAVDVTLPEYMARVYVK